MKDKAVHDLQPWLDSGFKDTGARIGPFPGYAQQLQEARRSNIDPEHIRCLRVALDPDVWAIVTVPEYAGQPFKEPGAMLP